jgi:acetate kinase
VRLDPERNEADDHVISADETAATVRVMATDEELMIARHARDLLAGQPERR